MKHFFNGLLSGGKHDLEKKKYGSLCLCPDTNPICRLETLLGMPYRGFLDVANGSLFNVRLG